MSWLRCSMKKRVGVDADVVDQLVERDELAAALGHPRPLAALDDVDELHDRGLEAVGLEAERRERRAHPRHVAVVVGAEHVDQPLVRRARSCRGGRRCRGRSRSARRRSGSGPGPCRRRTRWCAARSRLRSRRRGPRSRSCVDRVARPRPSSRSERSEDQVSKRTPNRSSVASIRARIASVPRTLERVEVVRVGALGRELGGELGDVVARVAVLGRLLAAHPGRDRLGEQPHLGAGVVDVVLALDRLAGALEQPRQRVAEGRAAAARRRSPGRSGWRSRTRPGSARRLLGGAGAEPLAGGERSRPRRRGASESARKRLRKPGPATSIRSTLRPRRRSSSTAQPLGDLARRRAQRSAPAASPRSSSSRRARASAAARGSASGPGRRSTPRRAEHGGAQLASGSATGLMATLRY